LTNTVGDDKHLLLIWILPNDIVSINDLTADSEHYRTV